MAYKKSKKLTVKRASSKDVFSEEDPITEKPAKAKKPGRPKKGKTKKPKSQHYVNGKEFLERIRKFYETDDLEDELSIMLVKISNGLSFAPNFINYSYKDDMIGDAILKMFSALKNKKFNVDSNNNPFSYFTTVAYHAFINRIKKEKKHRDTITKYQETVYDEKIGDAGVTIKSKSISSDDMFLNDAE